jgi:hypothetical protein
MANRLVPQGNKQGLTLLSADPVLARRQALELTGKGKHEYEDALASSQTKSHNTVTQNSVSSKSMELTMANMRNQILEQVKTVDNKYLKAINEVLQSIKENENEQEPQQVAVKRNNPVKKKASDSLTGAARFSAVKDMIVDTLSVTVKEARQVYEKANESDFDWDQKPRALRSALKELYEENEESSESSEDAEYTAPKFAEVRDAIIAALGCKVKDARQFYENAVEDDFDWDQKPRALKKAITEAINEYLPELASEDSEEKPAKRKVKASKESVEHKRKAVDFSEMGKTELRNTVSKLQVEAKDAGPDLAAFLKRVYKMAESHKIKELEALGEKKKVKFFFGRGKQSEEGKKRKMAAQILCA